MKKQKLIIAILILFNCQFSFAQQYKLQLDKLNNYLKTINDGYYGYFEVNGNDIYLRLQSGKYCKATITDLDKAYPEAENKSVFLKCKNGANCMTATYTSSNTNGIIISNNTNINTTEFAQLINDFLLALRATNPAPSLQTQVNPTSNTENKTTTSVEKALNKLNDYLKTFDNGHYGYFEIKDGYVYDWFKAGKYNKFKMEDIEGAVVEEKYNRVILKCKNDNKCISTDWKVNGKEDYSQFINGSAYNYQELADLLNNLRDAYLGKTPVVSNDTTAKTKNELQNNVDAALKERAKVVDAIINNKPVQKTTSNEIEFKKGDKIIIKEVYTSDGHFRVGGKSLCVGEKGTIISIGYDEINVSYYGKIKMDNGKIEEFEDFQPELISSLNGQVVIAEYSSTKPEQKKTQDSLKLGTFADCKNILSEGCRNYFLQSKIKEIQKDLNLTGGYSANISMDVYNYGDGIRLIVEPSNGRVHSVTIKDYVQKTLKWRPSSTLKWGSKWSKVEDIFGKGNSFSGGIHYPNFTVNFDYDLKLNEITYYGNQSSEAEIAAQNNRESIDRGLAREKEKEEEKIKNTPEVKAQLEKKLEEDYKTLLDQLDAKLREGDRIIQSEKTAIAAGGIFKAAVQKKLDKVISAGDGLIDSFNRKYQGKIPTWMAKEIIAKWRPAAVN